MSDRTAGPNPLDIVASPSARTRRAKPVLGLMLLAVSISGCNGGGDLDPCDEFAAPSDRTPSHCPAKPAAQPPPTRYCYKSLAQPDCFPTPQPGRTGYLGSY